jgi:hypothetical protein
MKPFGRYVALFAIGAAWLTAASIPAMAQAITTATATLSCGPPASFSAAFSAIVRDDTTVVNFTITAQSTGSPVVINQTAMGPVAPGGLHVMASGNVSLASGVTYTLTGSATLHDTNGNLNFNTIPIAFTNANNQITCGQQSFRDFDAKLEIDLDRKPNEDRFALKSSFTLSSTAPAIDPVTQAVTLQAGTFAGTIPPGSLVKTNQGNFVFVGVVDGAELEALIEPTGTLRYAFAAKAVHANLTGTKNPVTVRLSIGVDSGITSVTAHISP